MKFAKRFEMIFPSMAFLVAAHIFTALIQRDPWLVRKYLELGPFGRLLTPWFFPIVAALLLAIWLLCAWPRLKDNARTVHSKLLVSWGGKALYAFWLFSIMPQRVMDNNSGYIFITADNPVWWLIWEMDWARTLFALDILLHFIASDLRANKDTPFLGEAKQQCVPSMCTIGILSLFSLCVPIIIQQFALGGVPHVQDEIIQDWHARLLEAGLLTSPPMQVRASFLVAGIGDNGVSLFSTYQPGFAYLLAGARRVGLGKLLNPALGLASFWLLYFILKRTHGEKTARFALCIGLVSPFAILMQASLMNHLLMLFLLLLGAFSLNMADRGYKRTAVVMGGLALGLGWLTRRVDAIAMHIAWLCAWFAYAKSFKSKAFGAAAALVLSACIFTINVHLNAIIVGDPLFLIRHGQTVINDLSHFDPFLHLANFLDNLFGLGVFAFGGIVAALAGIGSMQPNGKNEAGSIERYFLTNAVFIVIGYSLYDYQDFCFGPRYFFPLLPLAAISIAVFLRRICNAGCFRATARLSAAGIAISILLIATQSWAVLGNEFWHINPELSKFVDSFRGNAHILFVTSPTRQRLELARHLQSRWRFSGDEVIELLSDDFIDTVGLKAFLEMKSPKSKEDCMKYIEQYQKMNPFRRPELYGINVYEVPRINTIAPLYQEVILAIDRGDEANEALIRALPNHKPLLIYRTPAGYAAETYRPAGVASFGDILVP